MKNYLYRFIILLFILNSIIYSQTNQPVIANHSVAKLSIIPDQWIDSAKQKLHIAYGHTSHGSQIITGMEGLQNWKGDKYSWNNGGTNSALDIHDNAFSGASDLGNPDRTSWETATRNYLNEPAHSDVNVIVWSWCGQVSSASEEDINTYLNLMNGLENDFTDVRFVYMTGHLDGSGTDGNLNQRNEQIRNYCLTNGKVLFDFADIESYDPDGNFYLDKNANDNCDYDSDNDGDNDKNWAEDWQNSHILWTDWFECSAAHSQPLNGNLKAYAAWWLWAKLAGWESVADVNEFEKQLTEFRLYQNYPNPFNPETIIKYQLPLDSKVTLKVYNILGSEIETLVNEYQQAGYKEIKFNASLLSSGIYIYKLTAQNYVFTRKMILLR